VATKEIRSLRLERERIRARHGAGAPGTFIVRQLSDALDAAVRGVWERVAGDDRFALLALGEYGRQELSPASSLDLLVLHPAGTDPADAAKALSYELWGAELDLGYAVYTPEEALRLARTRVDSELRFLDARLLAGDQVLFGAWWQALIAYSRSAPGEFLGRVFAVTQARRSSTDDACSCLEPDLMDGAGGLADLASIRWLETVQGSQDLPTEPGALSAAADLLHRIRNELHYLTGRSTDVFQMQYHVPVAEALAAASESHPEPAPEIDLLRTLYESCRTIAFALDSVLAGGLASPEAGTFAGLFVDEPEAAGRWPEGARESFLGLLSSGPGGRAGFRALEQTGALATALPEWETIRCLPQRSVYHRSAVDVHSFEVVAELAELRHSDDEFTRQVAHEAESDTETLLLAGLLHDIGKGSDEDHCIRGENLARSVTERIGVGEPQAGDVVWLVRNHLLLTRVATRRDIGDESLAAELAERIGSERRLRMLYLLTIADARATGPAAWSTWKATLISRLYSRVHGVLGRGDPTGTEDLADEGKVEALRLALAAYPPAVLERHLAEMPRGWAASQSLRGLKDQSRQMLEFKREDELGMRAVADADAGVCELTTVANDQPGLFSRISGVLALHGLNVVGAEAYTREDGIALSVFRLGAPGGDGDQSAEGIAGALAVDALAEDARKALRGRLSIDARLAQLRREQPAPAAGEPDVVVDDEASDFFTVVEVHAPDRIGLLYTITRALVEMDLDIRVAKVSTHADGVVDVFYVRDVEGQKVTDVEYAAEIARAIRYRLTA
jgi:[protein-PII] uridylyltransferase